MSEEMNKEAEVQEEAVDIPVTDGSEEEAADTAQTAEEETSEEPAQTEETEQSDQEAESQKEPETKTKTSFFGKKKKEKDKFEHSTLRRFWGYVSEGVSASKFTKNVLANFLGYADFEEFGLSQGTGERQSQMVIDKEISCDDLYEGQMLKLSWLPDRTCIIRYQGNGSFKVVSSENTRLAKDDTFECRHFINHEPAYLHGWKHGDREPVTYAIGKKNGIIVEHYLED